MLRALLASNPGIEVTPQVLLQFIAERTRNSPRESPGKSQSPGQSSLPRYTGESSDDSLQEGSDEGEGDDVTFPNARGRQPFERGKTTSRSSSAGTPSRPSSVPPKTPLQSGVPSAFDSSKRQRTTPLSSTAPSSWTKRPAPAGRRKSIDGSSSRGSSDNEVRAHIFCLVPTVSCLHVSRPDIVLIHLYSVVSNQSLRAGTNSHTCPIKPHITLQHSHISQRLRLIHITALCSPTLTCGITAS